MYISVKYQYQRIYNQFLNWYNEPMASLIGTHNRSNGIKQIPSRAVLSMNGAGIGGDETHPDTIIVLRDTRVFPGDGGETAPDFNTYDGSDWPAYGRYWYQERTEGGGNFKTAWALNPSAHYKQIQNERGGGGTDEFAMQRTVDIERAICWAANEDGHQCAILNLAGGSPDFESWKRVYVPFIVEAWEHGQNPYCRHVYGETDKDENGNEIPGTGDLVLPDGTPKPGQPQRIIQELEYLQSIGYMGGVVLTECGLDGGYGVAEYNRFSFQVTAWEAALRPYADMLIGFCVWEMGASEFNADYTNHMKQLIPYLEGSYLGRWQPPIVTPPEGTMKDIEVTITTELPGQPVQIRGWDKATGRKVKYVQRRWMHHDGEKIVYTGWETIALPVGITDLRGIEIMPVHDFTITKTVTVDCEEEPPNPNPPPVLSLARGAKGFDVSYYQGAYNWAGSSAEFGIIRCSDGMTANSTTHDANGIDRQFWNNATKLTAKGIPWAIYHFLRPGSIQAQADKVRGAIQQLFGNGTPPKTAVFDNGVYMPDLFIDVEDGSLTSAHVQEFYNALAADFTIGIYTGKPVWELITAGAAVWWSSIPLWIAAYGINDGTVPNWANGPTLPRGWDTAVAWQFTSNPIDTNIVGPYPPDSTPPTPPPPTAQIYDTSFMRAEPGIWRVVRRSDGSGENVWELPLDAQNDVRVKNESEGEWYFYGNGGIWRTRDTSMAPLSDGTARLYLLNDGNGGQIAPNEAEIGKIYSYTNQVNVKAKSNCADLAESSGTAVTTFRLKAVIQNYTFPETGFFVDWLYVVDGGSDGTEVQLYAIHEGRKYGWCGGGANIGTNVWGGQLAEVYFDRAIPPGEPPRYCE